MGGQFNSFPIDWEEITVDEGLEGDGSAGTPLIISDLGVTTGKINNLAVTTAKINNGAVTEAKLDDDAVATDKIQDDAVTADKLADTAVTPGSYTSADITVDQQGRITAASNGSGGSGITRLAQDKISGVNANNQARVGYLAVSGTPVVDVVWANEGAVNPSVTVSVSGGEIRILDFFTTYENTNGAAASLDIIVNGVGAVKYDAVPLMDKIFHSFDFTTASPSSQLYYDKDNTPQIQPYGYDPADDGVIKFYVLNIPSSQRFAQRFIWPLPVSV